MKLLGWRTLLVLAFLSPSGYALPELGGVEGSFVTWGAGARALGLGRTYVAVANDASAVSWNPGGLAKIERSELTGLSVLMWEGAMYHYMAVAIPTLSEGTLALNAAVMTVGGLERRNELNEVTSGAFGITKSALSLGYGCSMGGNMFLGGAVKYIGRWSEGWQSGFISGDVGGLWEPLSGVVLGLTAVNLATWRYETVDDLPRQFKAGAAVHLWDDLAMIACDVEANGRWRVGGEMRPVSPVAFRVGTGEWESSAGLGLQWDDTLLDYSGSLHRELGFTHRFSLTFKFGEVVSFTRQRLARQLFDEAYQASERGDAAGARQLLDRVLALEPNHPVAGYFRSQLK